MKPGWIRKASDVEGGLDPDYVPGAAVVATRALCLLTVQLRCMAEPTATDDLGTARDLWNQFRAEFDKLSLRDDLLETEEALIFADVGACDPEALISATWDIESLGILLWALQRLPTLPRFDAKFEVDDILAVSPSGAEASSDFICNAELRPPEDLEHEEWRSYHWLWRLRSMPHAGKNLLSPTVRDANEGYARSYPDDPLVERDLAAYGVPLFLLDLASEDLQTLRSLVELRAHALRWLTWGDEWSDVSMDT